MATKQELREMAEADLYSFIRLVAPHRVLGEVHKELIYWLTSPERKKNRLVLLPRDHQKSALAAYYAAWRITRNPAITILYVSATTPLAIYQLKAIKNVLLSDKYRFYWPEMINHEESRREEWSALSICVDHPIRRKEGIRDSTIKTGGITTNMTGFHCDLAILDDVVVKDNAYKEEGRKTVQDFYSFLASIESADAEEVVIGTRYHYKDLYDTLINLEYEVYNDEGIVIKEEAIYDVFERVAEDSQGRDGSGQFLWPRQKRHDGKYFGFNQDILAKKRAQYQDKSQYYSQYYNDPTDPSSTRISMSDFQYYEPKFLRYENGHWYFKDSRLSIFAGMDFAWSISKKADFTAIAVVGVSSDNDIYVLDIDRFKTEKVSKMWEHLLAAHQKWRIRKVRAESNMGQKVIIQQFKEYAIQQGSNIKIDDVYRTRHEGTKLERNTATLEPRYSNRQIWHYRGKNCQVLEEELVSNFPEHDDIEDALASACEIAKAPGNKYSYNTNMPKVAYHPRFGGVAV